MFNPLAGVEKKCMYLNYVLNKIGLPVTYMYCSKWFEPRGDQ